MKRHPLGTTRVPELYCLRGVMTKLVLLVVFAAACVAVVPASAVHAKGETGIIVGGNDIAPYFYVLSDPPPVAGWLGLLEATANGLPERAPTPDRDQLLAGAYDLYFDYDIRGMGLRTPTARYVPASPDGPLLLYQETGKALPYGWYALSEPAARYLDKGVARGRAVIEADASQIETDPIRAQLLHGRDFSGFQSSAGAGREYVVISSAQALDPSLPRGRITGLDAIALLDAYVATLRSFHATPSGGPALTGEGWTVGTPSGQEVFLLQPATADLSQRVYDTHGYGGYFDPNPALVEIVGRAVTAARGTSNDLTARTSGDSGMSKELIIAITVGALSAVALIGGGTALRHS